VCVCVCVCKSVRASRLNTYLLCPPSAQHELPSGT